MRFRLGEEKKTGSLKKPSSPPSLRDVSTEKQSQPTAHGPEDLAVKGAGASQLTDDQLLSKAISSQLSDEHVKRVERACSSAPCGAPLLRKRGLSMEDLDPWQSENAVSRDILRREMASLTSQLRTDMRQELRQLFAEMRQDHQQAVAAKVSRIVDEKGVEHVDDYQPHAWAKRQVIVSRASHVDRNVDQSVDQQAVKTPPRTSTKLRAATRIGDLGLEADTSETLDNSCFISNVQDWDESSPHEPLPFVPRAGSTNSDDMYVLQEREALMSREHVVFTSDDEESVTSFGSRRSTLLAQSCWSMFGRNYSTLEFLVGMCVLLNAVAIGMETEFEARFPDAPIPTYFRLLDLFFCGVFMTEYALRIAVFGIEIFFSSDWKWNVFDGVVILMQILDCLGELFSHGIASASLLRVVRLIRLIRITRIVRACRLIHELRTIVASVFGSLKDLCWCVVFISMVIFTISIFFTQEVCDRINKDQLEEMSTERRDALHYFYGSVLRTFLTLYEGIMGGLSWDEAVTPLMPDFQLLVAAFCLYIAFSFVAMLNIVTGVFVKKAMQHAQMEEDEHLIKRFLTDAFHSVDTDNSGQITWEEFKDSVATSVMRDYFKQVNVDPTEARGLFELLDRDGSGGVDLLEFASGCVRLRGPAKALELALLMHESRRMNEWLRVQITRIVNHLLDLEFMATEGVGPHGGFDSHGGDLSV